MKNRNKNIIPAVIIIILIVCCFFYYYYKKIYIPEKEIILEQNIKISNAAREFVIKHILLDENLIVNENQNHNDIMAKLPLRYNPTDINNYFKNFISSYKNIKFNFSEINNENIKQALIELFYNEQLIFKVRFVRNSKPKIAIILDDWGYNNDNFKYIEEIKYPFTISILPGLIYSKDAAYLANRNKKLVMLHLPMEPKRKLPLEKDTIKVNMSDGEIRYTLNKILSEIPYIKGVNNHQGSFATTDKRIMNILMSILKEKNLFFIDSLTDESSIAYKSARENKILTNKRDIFIDNQKKVEYNEVQIDKLKKVAKKKGYAIGIGHDDYITLQVLQKNMPLLESEGYEFVYVTELLF
ncbi:MAG: divergent polysaccharide deacetylase family protein [Candidatus Goldbacteria bacterium]|nr:divergent polysaccharide deacetylase family protein [Candidatus Goldiibacteriota bacterium]